MLSLARLCVFVVVVIASVSYANKQLELMQLYYYTLKHGALPEPPPGTDYEE